MLRPIAEALSAAGLPAGARILVALSGGADSTALLLALKELGIPTAALHVHHGIRGAEADREADFCRELCHAHGIPFRLCRLDVPALAAARGEGLEETARAERYRLLKTHAAELGCDFIATAHNLEDNAETVLLHLVRGTGLSGLCGIPARRGNILRPLLTVSRREIETFLAQRGQSFVTDSTNACTDLSRNRIRNLVMPELLRLNPAFPEAVRRMTENLSADEALLCSLSEGELSAEEISALPEPLAARRLRRAYTDFCGLILPQEATHRALALCRSRCPSAEIHLPGCRLCRAYDRLYFAPLNAQPAALPERRLILGGETEIPEAGLLLRANYCTAPQKVHNSLNSFYLSCDRIDGHLVVRSRRTGDTFKKSPKAGRRSLKRLFIDDRIPAALRGLQAVIADGSSVAAIIGYGADADRLALPGAQAIHIEIISPAE